VLLGAMSSIACGAGRPLPDAPGRAAAAIRYTFAVDRALTRITATVCFEGAPPRALVPLHEEGRARLIDVVAVDGDRTRPLAHEARIELASLARGECVRYRASIAARLRRSGAFPARYRIGDAAIASTGLWLWAPDAVASSTSIRARFELPAGMSASLLWPDAGEGEGWMELDDRAFRYVANVALGVLDLHEVAVPGACLEVAALDGPMRADRDGRAQWLGSAGRAVARVLGRFPAERASVLVVPVAHVEAPVLFGMVGRGMFPSVMLLAGGEASVEALIPDWTAVHEFAHLASPFVPREESYMTEGLATYYQETLRAREGTITAEAAWGALISGFARGRVEGTGRTLDDECRTLGRTRAYGRVYWAGAAIALLADVEYRRESRGAESLDTAMRRAAERLDRTMSAAELAEEMDGVAGGALSRTVARWRGSNEFPDVGPVLEWLGVRRGAHGIELFDAEGAAVRDAIMNDSATVASNPASCGS
jgi:hypothetical protein